jgi:hypothetical protein
MMAERVPLESERRVETLPADPIRKADLESVLAKESVVEVWVPAQRGGRTGMSETKAIPSDGYIFKFWVEYEDRYRAFEYLASHARPNGAWYRSGAPITKDEMVAPTLETFDSLSESLE